MITPYSFELDHPGKGHTAIKKFADGSRSYEPVTDDCQRNCGPILMSIHLKTDDQLIHVIRSPRAATLYEVIPDKPTVAVSSDLAGTRTSVPDILKSVKARTYRITQDRPVPQFGIADACPLCGVVHSGACSTEEPVVEPKSLRTVYEDMVNSGCTISGLEVDHYGQWVLLSTASKTLADVTGGAVAEAYTTEDPLISVVLQRRDPQHISYVTHWDGVPNAAKLEAGYLSIHEATKAIVSQMVNLTAERYDK